MKDLRKEIVKALEGKKKRVWVHSLELEGLAENRINFRIINIEGDAIFIEIALEDFKKWKLQ